MVKTTPYLEQVAIVLYRPRIPENIGAAARAACNMGISRISVVSPQNPDHDRIFKMATHSAAHLIESMQVYADLAKALEAFHYVVGTTARTGGHRKEIKTPREMAEMLIPISAQNQVALLFGPEDRGLTNAQLRYCHALVTIPTSGFSSLNLAQAVMILCYELLLVACPQPMERFVPRLANRRELDEMYAHLEETLLKINFIHPGNRESGMQNVRRFLSRVGLRTRDVKVIRGICRQIDWYTQRRLERMQRQDQS
jgi:tRNA/rRNA methyltransferase